MITSMTSSSRQPIWCVAKAPCLPGSRPYLRPAAETLATNQRRRAAEPRARVCVLDPFCLLFYLSSSPFAVLYLRMNTMRPSYSSSYICECNTIQHCRMHGKKVCITNNTLDKLCDLFHHGELSAVQDPKDKFLSKLYANHIL